MKADKSTRQWLNKERSRSGKKNGVVKYVGEYTERNDGTSKTKYVRNKGKLNRVVDTEY